MTPDQARRFYRDGYLRLPGVVPYELVMRARRLIYERMGALRGAAREALRAGGEANRVLPEAVTLNVRTGGSAVFMDLFEKTPIKTILERALGAEVMPVKGAQLSTLFPGDFGEVTNESGYFNKDTPHFGWTGHLDGLWNGGSAVPRSGTNIRGRNLAAWRSEPSTNGMMRQFPEHNANMMNFTALVGVALSDQREEGAGNLGLLRGAHKQMEAISVPGTTARGRAGNDPPDRTAATRSSIRSVL